MPHTKTKEENTDEALLCTARKRASQGATYWGDNWIAMEEDLRFVGGDQWPEGVKENRVADGRPCLTNNLLPTFVDQLVGDQRQNRPSIKVNPVDMVRTTNQEGKPETLKISSESGEKDYELAEVYTAVIKNIEYTCDAETSYDLAFQQAVESSMGYLRVLTDYLVDDSFDQDFKIKHIENQFSVVIDPNAREPDKSDMMWCIINDSMDKDEFEETYPNASSEALDDSQTDYSAWFEEDSVRIAEYFTREAVTRTSILMSDGSSYFLSDIEDVIDEMAKEGVIEVKRRKVKSYKVMWRKITGVDVLEGPTEIKCSTIPIVPLYGKKLTIKKKTMYRSLIRYSKDAQMMANFWDSAATESVALSPKAPYIASEDQIEGYEDDWETANTANIAVLRYNKQGPGDPGPRREQQAAVPVAEITLGMNSADKIKSVLGMFNASLGDQGNETSGRAIIARQRQGDRGTFVFIDNLSKAIRRVGKILVEMIPYTYDTERVVRLKFPDDTEDFVTLNKQILDEQTNEYVTIHDLNVVKYDVVVTTGPAYATQRMEAAETMIQFAQAVPNSAAIIADLIALNMDWPGADIIAERLRKIMPQHVLSKKEQEAIAEDMPEQQGPTPEQELEAQEIEVRGQEAEAKSMIAQADIQEAQADIVKAQLETDDAKAKLKMIEDLADGGDQHYQQVRELVAQAIAEMQQEVTR